jgi:hypothetical protein
VEFSCVHDASKLLGVVLVELRGVQVKDWRELVFFSVVLLPLLCLLLLEALVLSLLSPVNLAGCLSLFATWFVAFECFRLLLPISLGL